MFDQIFLIFADTKDNHKVLDQSYLHFSTWKIDLLCCEHTSAFMFDRIFLIFADNNDNHKVLDEFELWLDLIMDCGVSCSWTSDNISFTYLRTFQNIFIACWLSGERSFPFGLLVVLTNDRWLNRWESSGLLQLHSENSSRICMVSYRLQIPSKRCNVKIKPI